MLDNLGLGEFFLLALMALLFFGPERLPRIGAQIGRWIRGLTRYSSAFLNEWREEALAVHDAVEEVKGIRDELVAARAEIASTLDTARNDVGDAVSGARHDVQQQIKRSTQVLPEKAAPSEPPDDASSTDASGTEVAAAKTQAILDGLRDGRARSAESLYEKVGTTEGGSQAAGTQTGTALHSPREKTRPTPSQARVQAKQIEALRGQVETLRTQMRALQAAVTQVRTGIEARGEEKDQAVASPAAELAGEAVH